MFFMVQNYQIHNLFGEIVIGNEDIDIEHHNAKKTDPESFVFECLTVEDVEKLLNEAVECLCNVTKVAPSLAKTLLLEHRWSINEIVKQFRENANELLVSIVFGGIKRNRTKRKGLMTLYTFFPNR